MEMISADRYCSLLKSYNKTQIEITCVHVRMIDIDALRVSDCGWSIQLKKAHAMSSDESDALKLSKSVLKVSASLSCNSNWVKFSFSCISCGS